MVVHSDIVAAAESNLRRMLEEEFGDKLSFYMVKAEPSIDSEGEDNLNIIVVYEGAYADLDPQRLNEISVDLGDVLAPMGFYNIPTESYMSKNGYFEWLELKKLPPWQSDLD